VITFRSVVGESGGTRLGEKALEAHQHTLFRYLKNAFFSRNVGQNMLKNAYFFGKKAVKSPQRQEDPLQNIRWPPAAGNSAFVETRSSVLNLFYYRRPTSKNKQK